MTSCDEIILSICTLGDHTKEQPFTQNFGNVAASLLTDLLVRSNQIIQEKNPARTSFFTDFYFPSW